MKILFLSNFPAWTSSNRTWRRPWCFRWRNSCWPTQTWRSSIRILQRWLWRLFNWRFTQKATKNDCWYECDSFVLLLADLFQNLKFVMFFRRRWSWEGSKEALGSCKWGSHIWRYSVGKTFQGRQNGRWQAQGFYFQTRRPSTPWIQQSHFAIFGPIIGRPI